MDMKLLILFPVLIPFSFLIKLLIFNKFEKIQKIVFNSIRQLIIVKNVMKNQNYLQTLVAPLVHSYLKIHL